MNLSMARFKQALNGVNHLNVPRASCYVPQMRSFSVQKRGGEDNDYTHIIVGAGSAGCVLANRLSADSSNKVLLLEAGPEDSSWKIQMPAALEYPRNNKTYNWYYHTVPQRHMNNRKMHWPRGKVIGGSSSINSLVYVRGHAYDYDRWEKEGATGWSYADCLPYFKHSQCHELGADDYRGGDGPLHVSRGKAESPLFDAFLKAGEQCGYPFTSDMNGHQQEGFGWMDMTIHKGVRWSAANAYLRSGNVLKRKNLVISPESLANRIVFEGTKAVGIEYTKNNAKMVAMATHDVILSGGTLNSPQLLLLSGVGNGDELKQLDIPVVAHLPGVGQNLQDHLQFFIEYHCPKASKSQWKDHVTMMANWLEWFVFQTGLGATTNIEAGAFLRTRPGVDHPDIQLLCVPSANRDRSFTVHVNTLRETSRGFIKLRSRDPREHPVIDPNYLDTVNDRRDLREGVKLTREIIAQSAFDQHRGEELSPGTSTQSDSKIDTFLRENAKTNYHPCCTCKMGSEEDPMAVVDSNTRVFGLENLRVVDASIMPSNVSGNLNAPTIMIAEKAADIILCKDPLPRVNAPVWTSAL